MILEISPKASMKHVKHHLGLARTRPKETIILIPNFLWLNYTRRDEVEGEAHQPAMISFLLCWTTSSSPERILRTYQGLRKKKNLYTWASVLKLPLVTPSKKTPRLNIALFSSKSGLNNIIQEAGSVTQQRKIKVRLWRLLKGWNGISTM